MPYDLSDDTGADRAAPIQDHGPTGKASDVFRPQPSTPRPGRPSTPPPIGGRPDTPFDGIARGIFLLAMLVSLLCLIYLLWGVWSGTLAQPHFIKTYGHDDRLRMEGNLHMVSSIMQFGLLVATILFIFLNYDSPAAGYGMVIVALFLNVGVPWLSQIFLGLERATPYDPTTGFTIHFLQGVAWLPGVPGILLVSWDLVIRAVNSVESSKHRRKSLKYGQNQPAAHAKRRNVFMGKCWNLPYCREAIRVRCPVYTKRFFPCWHYKQGCMCEQHISVLGSAPDWKLAVAIATAKLEGRPLPDDPKHPLLAMNAGAPKLTMAEKKQRCRECVIYNTHQEQKYKLFVGIVMALTLGIIYLFNAQMIAGLGTLFVQVNSILGHLSFANDGGSKLFSEQMSSTVAWFVLIFIAIILVSKLLQLVEYCCFKIKI